MNYDNSQEWFADPQISYVLNMVNLASRLELHQSMMTGGFEALRKHIREVEIPRMITFLQNQLRQMDSCEVHRAICNDTTVPTTIAIAHELLQSTQDLRNQGEMTTLSHTKRSHQGGDEQQSSSSPSKRLCQH